MNKGDLINIVASRIGVSNNEAEMAVNAIFQSIQESLKKDGEVSLEGFGKFSISKRPTKKTVKFKASKGLTNSINTDDGDDTSSTGAKWF